MSYYMNVDMHVLWKQKLLKYNIVMKSISILFIHYKRWNQKNSYSDYNNKGKYDVRVSNIWKLEYEIEDSNAPLKIYNEICVRAYMSLKENNDLKKYPLCIIVFTKDCELTERNLDEDGIEICGIDGGDTFDTQALVLSMSFVSDMNIVILFQTSIKKSNADKVYKDKGTLKVVIMQYVIEHTFQ